MTEAFHASAHQSGKTAQDARDAQGFDAETHAEPNTPQAKGPRPTPPRLGLRQKVKAARRENRRRRQQAKRTPRKGRQ